MLIALLAAATASGCPYPLRALLANDAPRDREACVALLREQAAHVWGQGAGPDQWLGLAGELRSEMLPRSADHSGGEITPRALALLEEVPELRFVGGPLLRDATEQAALHRDALRALLCATSSPPSVVHVRELHDAWPFGSYETTRVEPDAECQRPALLEPSWAEAREQCAPVLSIIRQASEPWTKGPLYGDAFVARSERWLGDLRTVALAHPSCLALILDSRAQPITAELAPLPWQLRLPALCQLDAPDSVQSFFDGYVADRPRCGAALIRAAYSARLDPARAARLEMDLARATDLDWNRSMEQSWNTERAQLIASVFRGVPDLRPFAGRLLEQATARRLWKRDEIYDAICASNGARAEACSRLNAVEQPHWDADAAAAGRQVEASIATRRKVELDMHLLAFALLALFLFSLPRLPPLISRIGWTLAGGCAGLLCSFVPPLLVEVSLCRVFGVCSDGGYLPASYPLILVCFIPFTLCGVIVGARGKPHWARTAIVVLLLALSPFLSEFTWPLLRQ